MPWWQLFCNIEEYQINMLYALSSHSAICQLKVNKAWGEKILWLRVPTTFN